VDVKIRKPVSTNAISVIHVGGVGELGENTGPVDDKEFMNQ